MPILVVTIPKTNKMLEENVKKWIDLAKKKDYKAKKDSKGAFLATVKIADFGLSGTYKIQAYIKGDNGKYTNVGKAQKVTVSDIWGGQATEKEKNETDT